MNTLSYLDWGSVETAEKSSRDALRELCRPGALRELLGGVLADERLLKLSERHSWGDRLILWDDPVNQWRIRLHRFEDRADEPHRSSMAISYPDPARLLSSRAFRPEQWIRARLEEGGSLPTPSVVRTEATGSSYAIDNEMVHYVKTEADTISVIIQGPRLKERALRVRNGSIAWQTGRSAQSDGDMRSVMTTSDRVREIAELAHRLGLVDTAQL